MSAIDLFEFGIDSTLINKQLKAIAKNIKAAFEKVPDIQVGAKLDTAKIKSSAAKTAKDVKTTFEKNEPEIDINIDTKDAEKNIKSVISDVGSLKSINPKIDIDTKPALKKVMAMENELIGFSKVDIPIEVDTSGVQKSVQNAKKKLDTIPSKKDIELQAKIGGALVSVSKLENELKTIKGSKVEVEANISDATAKLDKLKSELSNVSEEEQIKITAQISDAVSEIGKLEGQLKGISDAEASLNVDITNAQKNVSKVESEIKGIPDAEVDVDVDSSGAESVIDSLKDKLKELSGSGGGLFDAFAVGGGIGVATAGIGLLASGIGTAVTGFLDLNEEIQETRKQTQLLLDVSGADLDKFSSQAQSIADTFDKDVNEVLLAGNQLAEQFGISNEKAFDLIEKGFIKGADAGDDFLSKVKEYPVQFANSGLNAEQFIKAATAEVKGGVFDDKFLDTIKETGLRLREFTPAVKDAIAGAFGADFATEIQARINDGTTSTIDAFAEISKKATDAGLPIQQYQTLIADVTGGAGEDLGGLEKAYELLKATSETILEPISEYEVQQNKALEASKLWNATLQDLFGTAGVGFNSFITDVKLLGAELFSDVIKSVKDFVKENKLLIDVFNVIVDVIKNYVIFTFNNFKIALTFVWNVIRAQIATFRVFWKTLIEGVQYVLDLIGVTDSLTIAWNWLKKAMSDAFDFIMAIPNAITSITDAYLDFIGATDKTTESLNESSKAIKSNTKTFNEYLNTLDKSDAKIRVIGRRIKYLSTASGDNSKEIETLTKALAELNKEAAKAEAIDKSKRALDAWGTAVEGSKLAFETFFATLTTYKEQAKLLTDRLAFLEAAHKGNTIEASELRAQLKGVEDSMKGSTKATPKLSEQLAKLKERMIGLIATGNNTGTEFEGLVDTYGKLSKKQAIITNATKKFAETYERLGDSATIANELLISNNEKLLESQNKYLDISAQNNIKSLNKQKTDIEKLLGKLDINNVDIDFSKLSNEYINGLLAIAKESNKALLEQSNKTNNERIKKDIDSFIKANEDKLKADITYYEKRNDAGELYYEIEINNSDLTNEEIKAHKESLNDNLIAINALKNQADATANLKYREREEESEREFAERKKQLDNDVAENKKKAEESAFREQVKLYGQLSGVLSDIAGDNFDIAKAFKYAEALINTYLAITAAIPKGPIAVALASAIGFAQVAKIASTEPKGAETGVVELNKMYNKKAGKTDTIQMNLAPQESVITKKGTLAKGKLFTNKELLEYANKGKPIEELIFSKMTIDKQGKLVESNKETVTLKSITNVNELKTALESNRIFKEVVNNYKTSEKLASDTRTMPIIGKSTLIKNATQNDFAKSITNANELKTVMNNNRIFKEVVQNYQIKENAQNTKIFTQMQKDLSELNKKFDHTSLINSTANYNVKSETKVIQEIKYENYL